MVTQLTIGALALAALLAASALKRRNPTGATTRATYAALIAFLTLTALAGITGCSHNDKPTPGPTTTTATTPPHTTPPTHTPPPTTPTIPPTGTPTPGPTDTTTPPVNG